MKSLKESTGKRPKKLDDRSRLKKKRSLTEDYQRDTQRSSSMDGGTGSTREREREDGTKLGPDGNIP